MAASESSKPSAGTALGAIPITTIDGEDTSLDAYSGKVIKWDEAINSKRSVMPERYAWDAAPPTVPDAEGNYPIPVPGKTEVL